MSTKTTSPVSEETPGTAKTDLGLIHAGAEEPTPSGALPTGPTLGVEQRPPPDLDPGLVAEATREELLREFGEEYLSIQALFHFCFVPTGRVSFLRDLATVEEWGDNSYVLLKYLAVHVRLAIEQGAYVWNGDQLVMTAGRLTTPNGTPIYLGLVRNQDVGQNPWVMNWVGERPSCAELPEPPRLPRWPTLRTDAEIVVAADLVDPERRGAIRVLDGLPLAAQASAIAGAVHWSIHRGLAVPQLHGGSRGFFVPLYLRQREDLGLAPDAAVPIVCVGSRIVVRAVLDPHVCYPSARSLVERFEQLPPWLVDAWEAHHEPEAPAGE
jgi:hypothetical protein